VAADGKKIGRGAKEPGNKGHDVVIPSNLAVDDLATYLDDIYHEFARFGEHVVAMPDRAV
jgi:hypothetical protein